MDDAISIIRGGSTSEIKAERIFDGLVEAYGLPTTYVDGKRGANLSLVREKARDDEWFEETYGTRRPMLAMAARGMVDEPGDDSAITRAIDDINERATIDQTVVGAASPVEVDPGIIQTLRTRAPLVDRVNTQAQAGFTAQYNTIDSRSDPIGMVGESTAVDLSGETPQGFGLSTETEDMKIYVDLVEISDFTQRAEDTLNYMDVTETTVGQRTIEHALFKNRQLYYGDPSVGSGNGDIEDGDAYDGLVSMADGASSSYVIDKSGTSSGFLEDLKSELTTTVENTGLTYDAAKIAVSPTMFDALENEANAVVRLDGYDETLNFGGRSIQIKGVEVFEDPNIRNYSALSSTLTAGGDNGDVFLYDSRYFQFRQLAPFSTVPLGRIGLGDRAAMFEYGTPISKSQGEHIRVFQSYDV